VHIGFWEVVVVLLVALVLFGPNRLPEMGRALGKAIGEFRRYTSELGTELESARRTLEEGASVSPDKDSPAPKAEVPPDRPGPDGKVETTGDEAPGAGPKGP